MRILRNSIIIILSLTLLLVIPITLFMQTTYLTILEPYNTIDYLEKSGVYEEVELVLKEELKNYQNNVNNQQGVILINRIITRVVEELVTSEWIASKMELIQINLWEYIIGDTEIIEPISIDDFYQKFIITTNEEIEIYSEEVGLPEEFLKEGIIEDFENNIPKNFDVLNTYGIGYEDLDKIKYYFNQGIKLLYILYAVIILTIILGFLTLNNKRKSFKWLGNTMIITGLISLFPIIAEHLYKYKLLSKIELTGILVKFESEINNFIEIILTDLNMTLLSITFGLIIVGVFFVIISRFANSKSKNSEAVIS